MADLRDALDEALDDLPRYMAVTQPAGGWVVGDPWPISKTCVYVDDVREMLRRTLARFEGGASENAGPESTQPPGSGKGAETASLTPPVAAAFDAQAAPGAAASAPTQSDSEAHRKEPS
jgi:hypothetical protein